MATKNIIECWCCGLVYDSSSYGVCPTCGEEHEEPVLT